MTGTTLPAPLLLADNPALDLLNSLSAPWGTEIEWLGNGQDLLTWLGQAGLISVEILGGFKLRSSPEDLDQVATEVRKLREWFRNFVAVYAGQHLTSSALDELGKINRLLAEDQSYRQIEPRAPAHQNNTPEEMMLIWKQERNWRTPMDLLLPIAESMGDLICNTDFARIKNCEGQTCTMWFRDVSKNHTRRWCSMAVCGNRAKAAAHRGKKRSAQ